MYAEHRYSPRQSRAVSLGGAFLINGGVIAGMLFFLAPQIVHRDPPKVLEGRNIPIPSDPKPIELKPLPKNVPTTLTPLPHAPDPLVPTESANPTSTTPIEYPPQPPLLPVVDTGPAVIAEPVLPPLIGAEQDQRYLKDFQPGYPSAELRAQRDGLVRIKVLIGTDGRVKATELVSATSDAFFDATRRQALSKWRFKPAARGGVPQESWKILSVRFRIEDQ